MPKRPPKGTNPVGRPTTCDQEVIDKANEYVSDDITVNWESFGHVIPSVVGLCRVVNRAKSTIYKWAEDKDNEFSDIVCALNEFQEIVLVGGTLKGDMNPTIGKLLLTKHGYSDKQEVEVKDTTPTPEKRKGRIAELLGKCAK